jgi:hypothetical protein
MEPATIIANCTGSKLTPKKLRAYPGLENLTDEQAKEAVLSIQQLAVLYFEIHQIEKIISIDNQFVVSLNERKRAA